MTASKKRVPFALAVAALLLVGAGCASNSSTDVTADVSANVSTGGGTGVDVKVDTGVNVVVEGKRTIKVKASQFAFEPNEIRVKQGEQVTLEVTSIDVEHGIAIPAFNLNSSLTPGKTTMLQFTADKKGSYPFFCSVFCGSGHGGMRGTLIVE